MKKIDEYLESIFRNFDENDEETKVMKEEARAHLLEEIGELRNQGLTEEESIITAISNFGSEKIVVNEMNQIFKKQSKFSNGIKKIILIVFITACIFKLINIGNDFINGSETYNKEDMKTTQYLVNNVVDKVKDKESLDESLKNEITQLVNEFNLQTNNGLYYMKIQLRSNPNLYYEYNKDVPEELKEHKERAGTLANSWIINYETTNIQSSYDYNISKEVITKMHNSLPSVLGRSSLYLFLASIILVFIYLMNIAYLKRTTFNR